MINRGFIKFQKHRVLVTLVFVLVLNGSNVAQRRGSPGVTTAESDVIFAVTFSPDGKTLAIARGAADPTQRFGRIELWDSDTGSLRHIIQGFDGPVRSISFSPDSQTIVSGSLEYHQVRLQQKSVSRNGEVTGEVKWWDNNTGDLKNKVVLAGDGLTTIRIKYSPDGKQLALIQSFRRYSGFSPIPPLNPAISAPPSQGVFFPAIMFTSELRFLDAQSGEQKLKVNLNTAGELIYSDDGRFMATMSGDDVKIYNPFTAKEVAKIKGFRGRPNALTFSPDSKSLAVVSTKFDRESEGNYIKIIGRSEVKIFDVLDWKQMAKMDDLGAVHCLAYEPSGRYLILGGMLNDEEKEAIPALKLWDVQSRKIARFSTGGETYSDAVQILAIARNGTRLAFTTGFESVKVVDTGDWKVRQTFDSASVGDKVKRPVGRFLLTVKTILQTAFNHDGNLITAETDQGEIKQWDPRTGELKFQLPGDEDPDRVFTSSNAETLAELAEGDLKLWSAMTHVRRTIELPHESPASAVAFSQDGKLMAVAVPDQVLLFDAATDSILKSFATRGQVVESLAFSNDDRTLATTAGNRIQLLNVADGAVRKTMSATTKVIAMKFAPGDRVLATAEGRVINLWDVSSGTLQRKLDKHNDAVNAIAFSADGSLLASGSDDRTAIIWEVASGSSKHTLKGHDQTVRAVAFAPDGHLLASGSGNASVVLWDVKTGRLDRILR